MTFSAPRVPVVVDASLAIEQIVETSPQGSVRWMSWVDVGWPLLVPAHFWPEVANAMLVGNRFDPGRTRLEIGLLRAEGVESVAPHERRLLEAIELAAIHGLSVYDALYVQLALETDGTLGTLDVAMRRAAEAEGIEVETLD
ncbi:MAG: type II toxin-antitoxin system VapC family toxin [Candidatus Limnocylindrales bacterium]